MNLSLRRLAVAAVLSIGLAACGVDSTTSTMSSSVERASTVLSDVSRERVSVRGLQRARPLAQSITVSALIGPSGGTLSIPEAGAVVVVPPGALAAPTMISMTARAGKLLAYDFSPHGTTFPVPLVLEQSLRVTNASPFAIPFLQLGYYDDVSRLSDTTAVVSERRSGAIGLRNWSFASTITHFSGYLIGTD